MFLLSNYSSFSFYYFFLSHSNLCISLLLSLLCSLSFSHLLFCFCLFCYLCTFIVSTHLLYFLVHISLHSSLGISPYLSIILCHLLLIINFSFRFSFFRLIFWFIKLFQLFQPSSFFFIWSYFVLFIFIALHEHFLQTSSNSGELETLFLNLSSSIFRFSFWQQLLHVLHLLFLHVLEYSKPLLTWCARHMRSKSCLCRNLLTMSGPNVNETPLSFLFQPGSWPGSDQSRSASSPSLGTSVGLLILLIWEISRRSGLSPPWQQNIFSSMMAAKGRQSKTSVNVLNSLILYRLLPETGGDRVLVNQLVQI